MAWHIFLYFPNLRYGICIRHWTKRAVNMTLTYQNRGWRRKYGIVKRIFKGSGNLEISIIVLHLFDIWSSRIWSDIKKIERFSLDLFVVKCKSITFAIPFWIRFWGCKWFVDRMYHRIFNPDDFKWNLLKINIERKTRSDSRFPLWINEW